MREIRTLRATWRGLETWPSRDASTWTGAPVLDPTCERLEVKFLRPTRPYEKVKGSWKYLYRAVDKAGATVDFLLTAKRDRKAALRFLRKAINGNGTPEKITIDKSAANKAAIDSHNSGHETEIEIRQIKYLNNIVEQDHRAIKRLTRPMLGFKSFRSAAVTLAGIGLMHMIRKGQLRTTGKMCPARQFYSLAG
jgi:putative transposase